MTATKYPNWFNVTGRANFERCLLPLGGPLRCLQVGVFTGDASVWLLDNLPGCSLVDVDTWEGTEGEAAHADFDWADVERVYDAQTGRSQRAHRLQKVKATSADFFLVADEAGMTEAFDFIYIDGAHDSYSVLNDAVGAYRVLKPGGLLAFDDYNWSSVQLAVDSFAFLYGNRLEPVGFGSQAWFRRAR